MFLKSYPLRVIPSKNYQSRVINQNYFSRKKWSQLISCLSKLGKAIIVLGVFWLPQIFGFLDLDQFSMFYHYHTTSISNLIIFNYDCELGLNYLIIQWVLLKPWKSEVEVLDKMRNVRVDWSDKHLNVL